MIKELLHHLLLLLLLLILLLPLRRAPTREVLQA
jgi:hypothetical protein